MNLPSAPPQSRYLRETRRRMAGAVGELKAIRRLGLGELGGVVARLREQHMAGRTAGYRAVVHLCQSVEDCLTLERLLATDRGVAQPPRASMVAMLLDTCRAIQLHAEAVAKTESYVRHRGGAGALPSSIRTDLSGRLRSGA